MGWYNNSWSYRKKITVQNGQVPGNLTNFPVLLSFTFSAGERGNVLSAGEDIRITESDGETEVPREIESYSQSTGVFVGWAKTNLSGSVDTVLYIYFGNAGASEPAEDATYGRENVWDANYKGVWHLQQDPSGGADSITDSTSGDQDLDPDGVMLTEDQVASKVGGGIDFEGTDDTLRGTTEAPINITDALTMECWIKTSTVGRVIGGKWSGTNDAGSARLWRSYLLQLEADGKGSFYISDNGDFTSHNKNVQTIASVATGAYLHLVAVYIPSTSMTLYVNGSQNNQNTTGIYSAIHDGSAWFRISGNWGPPQSFFDGEIDEFRVSNTNRSTNWIQTSYNNQNDPAAFHTIGGAETVFEVDITFEAEIAVTTQWAATFVPALTFEAEIAVTVTRSATAIMARIMTELKAKLMTYNQTGESLVSIKTFKRGEALKTPILPAIFIRPVHEAYPKIFSSGRYDCERDIEIRVATKDLNMRTALSEATTLAESIKAIIKPNHTSSDWNLSDLLWNAEVGPISISEPVPWKNGVIQECVIPWKVFSKGDFPTETVETTLAEKTPVDMLTQVYDTLKADSNLSGIKTWSKGRMPPRMILPACSVVLHEVEYEKYETEHNRRLLPIEISVFSKQYDKEAALDANLSLVELFKASLWTNIQWGGYARDGEFEVDFETYETDNGFLYGTQILLQIDCRERLN